METPDHLLTRWQSAGLIDPPTAASIRAYEAAHAKPASRQWQVLLALILGGILLGAGVLLFVAAHWDAVSPLARMLLVLSMLVFFHGAGIALQAHFPSLATAMHAVGTISAGAAIALVGQIFNMQEHWPAAILLWALAAAAGWFLLHDQFQQTLTLLLTPAWIVCEWADYTHPYAGQQVYLARIVLVLGIIYLVAFRHSPRRVTAGILFAAGALVVPISIGFLATGWQSPTFPSSLWGFVPLTDRLAALALILAAAAFGFFNDRQSLLPAAVAATLAWALPWAQTTVTEGIDGPTRNWSHSDPNLLAYVLVAAAAVFLVVWGVRTLTKPLVNYGMVAFAATVFWFYFSNIMDKLNRSLGLILLGILFLAGGWALETTRRRLVHSMAGGLA